MVCFCRHPLKRHRKDGGQACRVKGCNCYRFLRDPAGDEREADQ